MQRKDLFTSNSIRKTIRTAQLTPSTFLQAAVVLVISAFTLLFLVLPLYALEKSAETVLNATKLAKPRAGNVQIPIYFIENHGQIDSSVRLYHTGKLSHTYFSPDCITMRIGKMGPSSDTEDTLRAGKINSSSLISQEIIRLMPISANKGVSISGVHPLSGKVNYFRGKSRITNIPTYEKVLYTEMFDGVDVVFYGNDTQLEYDLFLKPGTDPGTIRFALQGTEGLRIDESGNLLIQLKDGIVTQHKPHLYQELDGKLSEVDGSFKLLAQDDEKDRFEFGFQVRTYDKNHSLVIDPIINYSSYIGGSGDESFVVVSRLDSGDNIYLTGTTLSPDYPTFNPLQAASAGGSDIFVAKLSPDGSTLIWSTYLGGSGDDFGGGLTVDSNDDVWLSGQTNSTDFPTKGAFQTENAGSLDAFIAHLSADGATLEYSTYLGGSGDEQPTLPRFDSGGNLLISGNTTSPDFPATTGALDTTCGTDGTCNFDPVGGFAWGDVFVTRFTSDGTDLTYSTFIGGSGEDFTFSFDVDGTGAVYVHGGTSSNADFPIVNAFQDTFGGGFWETFLLNLDAGGSSLVFSTYLGGSGNDFPSLIKLTPNGILVCGRTLSADFPTQNPLQGSLAGGQDGFLSKFSLNGTSLLYSTYLGGTGTDRIREVLVDEDDNFWVNGITDSVDFPLQDPILSTFGGAIDAFASKISADGSSLLFSTYVGGSGEDQGFTLNMDSSGGIYLTGYTNSKNFPTANPLQSNNAGGFDAFIVRLTDSFIESFSDGNADGWAFKDGQWSVIAAAAAVRAGFALTGTVTKKGEASAPEFILGVGSLEADVQIQTLGAKASLLGWFEDKKNFVELQILEKNDKLVLKQKSKSGGSVKVVDKRRIDPNVTYKFVIIFDGKDFQVFVDNDPTAAITMEAVAPPAGGTAFRLKASGGIPATGSITNIVAN